MPPRSGQLDQISQAIGELKGKIDGLDRYTHEREHAINNLRQDVAGLGNLVTREVAKLKAEIKGDLDRLSERVDKLEATQDRQIGAKSLASWILQSPLIGWLVAAGLFVAAWWKGELR